MKHGVFFISFLFLCSGLFEVTTVCAADKLQLVDSLIEYNQLNTAERVVDSALKDIKLRKASIANQKHKAELLFRKGIIVDNQFDHGNALPSLLSALKIATIVDDRYLICQVLIRLSFNYEKANNYDVALEYLNQARAICSQNSYHKLWSSILIRYALLHRFFGDSTTTLMPDQKAKMDALDFKGSIDSAVYYAEEAIKFAKTYDNQYDLNEAYITLGILYGKSRLNKLSKANEYYALTIPYWRKTNLLDYVAMMYHNIARNLLDDHQPYKALSYNDSGYQYYTHMSLYYHWQLPKQRGAIYNALKIYDSAYYYAKLSSEGQERSYLRSELSTAKRLEEQFQNDKRSLQIISKNRQIALIVSLLIVIIIAAILLFRKNRVINRKNVTISNQIIELSRMLDQKQVLLSELQHRVKNNLQHVISVLEMQKESIDFNNIEELIRGNQNRVHSMALLHKKLNVSDNVNDVDLGLYIKELGALVKDSYINTKKHIELNIDCSDTNISIEKALPLGLITAELISNSMKHAFPNKIKGVIHIEIKVDKGTELIFLYSDNGIGYKYNGIPRKGLGVEIVQGLIDQLYGTYTSSDQNGFAIEIRIPLPNH